MDGTAKSAAPSCTSRAIRSPAISRLSSTRRQRFCWIASGGATALGNAKRGYGRGGLFAASPLRRTGRRK
jgi:hypothetical protein